MLATTQDALPQKRARWLPLSGVVTLLSHLRARSGCPFGNSSSHSDDPGAGVFNVGALAIRRLYRFGGCRQTPRVREDRNTGVLVVSTPVSLGPTVPCDIVSLVL